MSPWLGPELSAAAAHLAPYARASLERAAALAARLHAARLSGEHWLAALLQDEECAATRIVLHAFADPETIGVEVLALCEGIMVVGSGQTLPFSVRALEVLARTAESAGPDRRVEPTDLFEAAWAGLTPEAVARLAALGGAPFRALTAPPPSAQGSLFRNYAPDALRALGASARCAKTLGRDAIAPLHLLVGALEVDAGLRERTALTGARVRLATNGLDEDLTPVASRRIEGDERLRELLRELPGRGESAEVLACLLARGGEELVALLRRQRVTAALVERCRGVFLDPEPS